MRHDLLQLDDEKLAVLANRGLVKRGRKMLDKGDGPTVATAGDGTGAVVTATFPDATVTLEPGVRLVDAACTCGATKVCRHRVAAVMAYIAHAADAGAAGAAQALGPGDAGAEGADPSAAAPSKAWSPGDVSDAQLKDLFGALVLGRAMRRRAQGFTAEIRRHPGENRGPTVALPTSTVRFLVAGSVEMAHADVKDDAFGAAVVLAVWAMRKADRDAPDVDTTHVRFEATTKHATADHSALLTAVMAAMDKLARTGVAHLPTPDMEALEALHGEVKQAGLCWLALALEALMRQLEDHRTRGPAYRPERACALWAEVRARLQAAAHGALAKSDVLGEARAFETRAGQVRLLSLGARVEPDGPGTRIEVYLHDARTSTTLRLEKSWDPPTGAAPLSGAQIAQKTLHPGIQLGALSRGQIVTQTATRHVSRQVTIGRSRVAKSMVQAQSADWATRFAPPTWCPTAAALLAAERDLPPAFLRPRVVASGVHVLPVSSVVQAMYVPGSERVVATLLDTEEQPFVLEAVAGPRAPHRLAAVADALQSGKLAYVAGHTTVSAHGLSMQPTALVTDRVVVPDVALEAPPITLERTAEDTSSHRGMRALQAVRRTLAERFHRGLRAEHGAMASEDVRTAGFLHLARDLHAGPDTPDALHHAVLSATMLLAEIGAGA